MLNPIFNVLPGTAFRDTAAKITKRRSNSFEIMVFAIEKTN